MLPDAERWRGASAIAERCTRGGRLNLAAYVYRSLPSWMVNARLFKAVLESRAIDVAIGNEAYEVDIPLILRVLRVRIPFVMIFDFVATDPMTAQPLERLGAWCLNALWSLDGGIYDGDPHSAIFIGEIGDIPSRSFGLALGGRREHARDHYDVVGHVIGFDPQDYADRGAWRGRLGYGEEPLIICAVGGTSIGRDLLELCGQAFLPLRDALPDAHMVLVCGPRLAPESLRAPAGVTVLGYVPRLYEHYACCDVAVVQCGASSTTELAALRRPFIHFPIDGHFEQEVVARRLARYEAGRRLSLTQTTPAQLAAAITQEYGRVAAWDAMPVDGARRAAQHVLHALDGRSGAPLSASQEDGLRATPIRCEGVGRPSALCMRVPHRACLWGGRVRVTSAALGFGRDGASEESACSMNRALSTCGGDGRLRSAHKPPESGRLSPAVAGRALFEGHREDGSRRLRLLSCKWPLFRLCRTPMSFRISSPTDVRPTRRLITLGNDGLRGIA